MADPTETQTSEETGPSETALAAKAADDSRQEPEKKRVWFWSTWSVTLASSWRTTVLNQADRLHRELSQVPEASRTDAKYAQVKSAIDEATHDANTPTHIDDWVSGKLVERAWGHLQAAQELLIYLEEEGKLRSRLPHLLSIASGPASIQLVQEIRKSDDQTPIDRDAVCQLVQQHNVGSNMDHARARQLRNRILAFTILLSAALIVATVLVPNDLRVVMGIGALAGLLTTILPLSKATNPTGPYGLAAAQAVLKVPAGAATALLGVLLLRGGFGGFKPATGDIANFYAVIFGFSQQAFTQLVDKEAASLTSDTSPRTAPSAKPASRSSQ